MALWSTKRRFAYGGSFVIIVALLTGLIFWKIIYKAPTCADGRQNGDEKGIDCGGSCQNLCTSDSFTPIVLWSKIFNISGDVYSAVAYVQNPNINSKNQSASYEFKIYDANNKLILTKGGTTSIPKNKIFAVFETGLIIKGNKTKSADFQFTNFGPWEKDTEKEPVVTLKYGALLATTTSPRIEGTVSNASLQGIPQLELAVLVLDGKQNVVAASRTFIDNLLPSSSQDFVFTWPKKFDFGVEECTNPLDVAIALDRSGSMKSESLVPPEPFSTVKNTAKTFINNLSNEDQVSIFSFGNNATEESSLSANKQLALTSIDNLNLSTTTVEQTNITSGLTYAFEELKSVRKREDSSKILILLTDGVPTEPRLSGQPDYPTISAKNISAEIKDSGVKLYTIGLGKTVSESFLKALASDDSYYFFAPNKETLSSIYTSIGQSLCNRKPNVITVIYRKV